MFRIDRRFVKLSGPKVSKTRTEEKSKVGAEGKNPDAAASATAAAEDMAKMYISAAEQEMNERANEIITAARLEAEEILSNADKEAFEIRKTAIAEGHAEGKAEAHREYEEKLEQMRANDEAALRSLLDEIARERDRVNSEVEEDTVALAVEIVRKIYNPAKDVLDDVFILLIKNALRQLSSDRKFIIRVGPDEYERYFSSGAAEIELDSGSVVTATVLRDTDLNEGDLIIDTDDITVNAGLESQLRYVKLAFEGANQYEP